MIRRIAVAGFATSGILFALVGLLPAFRGDRMNVILFSLGVTFLVLALVFGSALARKRSP